MELPRPWVAGLTGGKRATARPKGKALTDAATARWLEERPAGEMCRCLKDQVARSTAWFAEHGADGAHDHVNGVVWGLVRDARDGHPGVASALAAVRAAFLHETADRGRDTAKEWASNLAGAVRKVTAETAEVGEEDPCTVYKAWRPIVAEKVTAEPRWHDFAALIAGDRKRAKPKYGKRADGQALIYPGKEHSIYGETEAGKGMFLAMVVAQCLGADVPVAVVDFEEGDELEWGSRLVDLGVDPDLMMDRDLFRYATPESAEEADADVADAIRMETGLVIFEGVSAAYGLYGWPIKENDSATAFRARLVKPVIATGFATVASDHVTKATDDRGRYAIGGVMKLNMVNGAAYLLKPSTPIVRGAAGSSMLFLTKDRPGAIKEHSRPTKDPTQRLAGILRVDSIVDGKLVIDVTAPVEAELDPPSALELAVLQAIGECEARELEPTLSRISATVKRSKNDTGLMVDALVLDGRLTESSGARNARVFRTAAMAERVERRRPGPDRDVTGTSQ